MRGNLTLAGATSTLQSCSPGEGATMKSSSEGTREVSRAHLSYSNVRTQTLAYFIVAVLGFSFWFFMAVPFASHRESYWYLGMVHSQSFGHALSFAISSTYRPLAEAAAWLGFLFLDPSVLFLPVFYARLYSRDSYM